MLEEGYYSIVILPPAPLRPFYHRYADKIRNQARECRTTIMPHLTITGFEATPENAAALAEDLEVKLSETQPFPLEVGKQQVMANSRFPRNLSLMVTSTGRFQDFCNKVISHTSRFTGISRRDLEPFVPHIVIVEDYPVYRGSKIMSVAESEWSNLSFEVDRIFVVKEVNGAFQIPHEIPLCGAKMRETMPPRAKTENSEFLLATLFAFGKPIVSKLRLQKLVYILGREYLAEQAYTFHAAEYGPYSSNIREIARSLQWEGILNVTEEFKPNGKIEYTFDLTDHGKIVAGQYYMNHRSEADDMISCFREFGDRSVKYLLDHVHSRYPEMRDNKYNTDEFN